MESTEEVLNAYREANAMDDIDRVVELHDEDAVIISRGHVRRGHADVREHYEEMSDWMGGEDMEMETFEHVIEGDLVMFTYSLETPQVTWDFAADTIVIQDGKITHHTVAAYDPDDA